MAVDCSALNTDIERNVSLCCGFCKGKATTKINNYEKVSHLQTLTCYRLLLVYIACDFAKCPAETTCVNMGLDFKCRCREGYELSANDGTACIGE